MEEGRLSVLKSLPLKGRKHELPIEVARYWKHNRIVWAGPAEVPEELSEVVASLNSCLTTNQFRTEERPFAAHVTLIRNARVPGAIPELPRVSWPLEEVVLVRSRLSPKGSSYEVVRRYPLR